MKYRKKPVVIEAVKYMGGGDVENSDVPDWMWTAFENGVLEAAAGGRDPLRIKTLEGVLTVRPGDYIIQGVKGELYPCKPDIFEATYELVDEAVTA